MNRNEALWREYHDADCDCGGKYEAEITIYGIQVTCPDCGDTFEVEPCMDEEEQRVRY